MPASISLIRHAEKQLGDGPPRGVSVDGTPDPESLTPRGWQRAGALIGLFVSRAGQHGTAPLATPDRLVASEVGPHSHSRRPVETLQPLSERLGLPLDEPFLADDLDHLVQAIQAMSGHVLVAWEHKRIPRIANMLVGRGSSVPQVWPDGRFDLVWVLEPDSTSGGLRLRQVPQLLLAGDRAEPIG
jgi:broad specificity phosphatase PhoE